jgi:hypothetical protein
MNEPLRLHLGCGETLLPGYVNIDYPQGEHNVMRVTPDLEIDLMDLTYPAETVDEIRLHHVFEHFNRVVALGMLIRWHGWLKRGGKLVIETPDFLASAAAAIREEGANRMSLIRHIEGDQAASWAYHVGQWYPERFQRTLLELGYTDITTETVSTAPWHDPGLHNVIARATKDAKIPLETMLTRAERLLWESTVHPAEEPTWMVWCGQLRNFVANNKMPNQLVAHQALQKGCAISHRSGLISRLRSLLPM